MNQFKNSLTRLSFSAGLCSLMIAAISNNVSAQNTFPSSGYVGIGTTSPQGNLEIFTANNTANNPLFSIRSDFHTAGNYGMIRFGDYTQTTDYQKGALIYESVAGSARGKFHIALENTDGNGSVSLSDAKLTVLSSGNVGIGTVSPDSKLTVNGTIHAKEIKVDTSIPAPDYVFEKDYKLKSLPQVALYIDQHKHLPEIPSAKRMEQNGINLTEMNMKLLQKVEELTLYLIEKDKADQKKQAQIDQLRQQLNALNKKVNKK